LNQERESNIRIDTYFQRPRTAFEKRSFKRWEHEMKRIRITVVVLLALSLAASAYANPYSTPKATKTGFGIMKALVKEVVEETPETTSGRTRTATVVEVVSQTNRIPARLGVRFGFTYSVTNLPARAQVVWKKIVKHPPIHKPDGSTSRGFTFLERHVTSPTGTIETFTGYGFDHAYELVPGKWSIALWYDNKRLVEQTFEVIEPEKKSSQQPPERDK